MHYTDILHTDATLDMDNTQTNVSDCNIRQRTHAQEVCLGIFLNEPLLHDQDVRKLMTHISRTRRVNLDRMFHRIGLDPGFQIKLRQHFRAYRKHPKPVARSVVKNGHT